jgi:hypothetical protein
VNSLPALEQRYRKLLKWYPQTFQRERGEEMLAVLLDGIEMDRDRPGFMDTANLIFHGVLLRLRPSVPRSVPTMFYAIRLMYVGALLEAATMITVWATFGSLKANILKQHPHVTAAQWHLLITARIIPLEVSLLVGVCVWLWMAWANGRKHSWARILFVVQFGLSTLSLLNGLKQGSAKYARLDLLSGVLVWLLSVAIMLLLFNKKSTRYYRKGTA